jgi:hypothetical protein
MKTILFTLFILSYKIMAQEAEIKTVSSDKIYIIMDSDTTVSTEKIDITSSESVIIFFKKSGKIYIIPDWGEVSIMLSNKKHLKDIINSNTIFKLLPLPIKPKIPKNIEAHANEYLEELTHVLGINISVNNDKIYLDSLSDRITLPY